MDDPRPTTATTQAIATVTAREVRDVIEKLAFRIEQQAEDSWRAMFNAEGFDLDACDWCGMTEAAASVLPKIPRKYKDQIHISGVLPAGTELVFFRAPF